MRENNKSYLIVLLLYSFNIWNLVDSGYFYIRDDAGDECAPPRDFIKTAPNSKYLISHSYPDTIRLENVNEPCKNAGLQAAVINSQEDLAHLEQAFYDHDQSEKEFGLGIKFDQALGYYTKAESSLPILFQAFYDDPGADDPLNEIPNQCVSLRNEVNGVSWVMQDTNCLTQVYPLCQFPEESNCSMMSPSTVSAQREGLEYIGSSLDRAYFVGYTQAYFGQALELCDVMSFKLLDFDMESLESQDLHRLLKAWQQKSGVHDNTAFWTSGHLSNELGSHDWNFTWLTTETNFNPKITTIPWKWDDGEPADNMKSGTEGCISFAIPTTIQDETFSGFFFRFSNCKVPYYYVCYRDNKLNTTFFGHGANDTDDGKKSKKPCVIDKVPSLNLAEPGYTKEEILALAELNIKYSFAQGRAEVKLPESPSMEVEYIKTIAELTKKSCPNEHVPHEFINVMKTFIMVYLYNIKSNITPSNEDLNWKAIVESLEDCNKKLPENAFSFEILGDFIVSTNGTTVLVPAELVDDPTYPPLDFVIDTFWHMFQLSLGVCYPMIDQTQWQVDYYFNFKARFLDDLLSRWLMVTHSKGDFINYGSFIGDFDLTSALYNLRACSVAVLMDNNILDRLLVRPIELNEGTKEYTNTRNVEGVNPKTYFS